jgi:hypothetical protein
MQYPDSDSGFQRSASGGLAFYPWGRFGRGYIVPGPAEMAGLRATVRVYLGVGLVTVLAIALLWKLHAAPLWVAAGFMVFALQLVVFHFHVRAWDLEPARERFVTPDNTESFAAGFNGIALWSLLLVMALFAALGLFMLLRVGPAPSILTWTAIFGFGSVYFGRIALVRRRLKRRSQE